MISIITTAGNACPSIALDQSLVNNLLQNSNTASGTTLVSPLSVIGAGQTNLTGPSGRQVTAPATPSSSSTPKGRSIRCQFCPQKHYSHYSVYISHLNHSHRPQLQSDIRIESRTFDNYDDFSKFKCQVEFQTGTHYNKSNSRSDSYILFKCHRFGEPRGSSGTSASNLASDQKNNKKARKVIPKEWNWTKSCPAFMRMIKIENDKYWTEYCTYHLGHEDNQQQTSQTAAVCPTALALPVPATLALPLTMTTNDASLAQSANDTMDYCNEPMVESHKSTSSSSSSSSSSSGNMLILRSDPQQNKQMQTISLTIPVQQVPLIENIVELIKNQEKLNLITDTVNSIMNMTTTTDNATTHNGKRDRHSQSKETKINNSKRTTRTSPRKRKTTS